MNKSGPHSNTKVCSVILQSENTRFFGALVISISSCLFALNAHLVSARLLNYAPLNDATKEFIGRVSLLSSLLAGVAFFGWVWIFSLCIFMICSVILEKPPRGSYIDFWGLFSIAQFPCLLGLLFMWVMIMSFSEDAFYFQVSESRMTQGLSEAIQNQIQNLRFFRITRAVNTTMYFLSVCGDVWCTRYFFRLSFVQASVIVCAVLLIYKLLSLLLPEFKLF
jgi:hypothetical protein